MSWREKLSGWFGRRRRGDGDDRRRFDDAKNVHDLEVEQQARHERDREAFMRLLNDRVPPEEVKRDKEADRAQRKQAREAERAERRELPVFLKPEHYVRHRLEGWVDKLWQREQAWHALKELIDEHGLAETYRKQKEQAQEAKRGQVIENDLFEERRLERERERDDGGLGRRPDR